MPFFFELFTQKAPLGLRVTSCRGGPRQTILFRDASPAFCTTDTHTHARTHVRSILILNFDEFVADTEGVVGEYTESGYQAAMPTPTPTPE
jgi:hypothetical protein